MMENIDDGIESMKASIADGKKTLLEVSEPTTDVPAEPPVADKIGAAVPTETSPAIPVKTGAATVPADTQAADNPGTGSESDNEEFSTPQQSPIKVSHAAVETATVSSFDAATISLSSSDAAAISLSSGDDTISVMSTVSSGLGSVPIQVGDGLDELSI